jgi:branched-chain amino acid transport system ATP-binding protein
VRWVRDNAQRIVGDAPLFPLAVLFGLNAVDELDRTAFAVLAPNIRDHFGLSIAEITAVAASIIPVALLLELPVAYWADRRNRVRMAAIGAFVWAAFSGFTGLAVSVGGLVLARMGSALGKTMNATHNSLLADYYPTERRAGVYYAHRLANSLGSFIGPLAAGLLAALFTWRTPFFVFVAPTLVFAVIALRLQEPTRGLPDRVAAGADAETAAIEEEPAGFGETFRTLMSRRAARRIYLSLPFLAASLFGAVPLLSQFYEDVFNVGEVGRGIIFAAVEPAQLIGVVLGYVYLQNHITRDPGLSLRLVGLAFCSAAAAFVIIAIAPNLAIALAAQTVNAVVTGLATPGLYSVFAFFLPARMRTQGFAVGNLFVLLGVPMLPIAGAIGDAHGLRIGILVMMPILVIGGLIFGSAGKFVNGEIEDVQRDTVLYAELRRRRELGTAPILVVRDLDVAYDQTQVLFGVDLEVADGEIVALLGTNGAGKSTVLKAISGLVPPIAGRIVFDGRDISSLDANSIAKLGITQVPGGRGVFPGLTVAENLRAAAWLYRDDRAYVREATERVLEYFPALRDRLELTAGSLSGGEQQMLSLAKAFIARPKLLMVDELSLGLAPTIVESLLEIVWAIHANGTTIVLVEQSVSTALRLADRAVFLEKGEVRFEGSTSDLLARTDLLRAVYLKGSAAGNGAPARTRKRSPAKTAVPEPASNGAPILEARDVVKRYGGVRAVDDVSLALRHGEVLGLIGPNGAGKTTLLDLISGFAPCDGGWVALGDREITEWPAHARARAGIGRTFQDARLWPSLTVREVIAASMERHVEVADPLSAVFGLPAHVEAEGRLDRRVKEVIELVGLGAFGDKFISELSTGSRRMVELACLLANRASVLLLDEPSSGIAQKEAEALGPVLKAVQRHLGASILIIEHDMPLLTSIADRLVALEAGAVVAEGAPADVLSHPRVVAAYLGGEDLVQA